MKRKLIYQAIKVITISAAVAAASSTTFADDLNYYASAAKPFNKLSTFELMTENAMKVAEIIDGTVLK